MTAGVKPNFRTVAEPGAGVHGHALQRNLALTPEHHYAKF